MLSIGFNHRPKPDGTVDSICLQCFRTVATVNDEEQLATVERQHRCDPNDLAGLRSYAPPRVLEVFSSLVCRLKIARSAPLSDDRES